MKLFKKALSLILLLSMTISLCAGSISAEKVVNTDNRTAELLNDYKQNNENLTFNNSAWKYDKTNDVYWQIKVGYCSNPETTDYETMGIYVPGAYMNGTANGDGMYTCTINTESKVNNYTAKTAPIVFPVNTPGYSAQAAPTSYNYNDISSYIKEGFIYVNAGMRGRENGYDANGNLTYSGGAPWGVTDLKAAVRYYRFNQNLLPGNTNYIYTFGHSGGGAQSSLMGATGDSELYYKYLESIGAAMYDTNGNYISDAIRGAMCWCPITSLDYADEAYEWNMGQYSSSGTRSNDTWTSALSDDLAASYASYLNSLNLTDENGTGLNLEKSKDGIYTSGTYYDYLLSVIDGSLNNFLNDTTFPYTVSTGMNSQGGMGGGGAPGGAMPNGGSTPSGAMPSGNNISSGAMPSGGSAPNGAIPGGSNVSSDTMPSTGSAPSSNNLSNGTVSSGKSETYYDYLLSVVENFLNKFSGNNKNTTTNDSSVSSDGANSGNASQSTGSSSTTYETAQDYINSLNSNGKWIEYDAKTNTAKVISIEAFVKHCKNASKNVGAFDDLNRSQAENNLFGNDENESMHFDTVMTSLLKANEEKYSAYSDWNSSIVQAYQSDIQSVDKFGSSSKYRMNMYNPMYYLSGYYKGYNTSTVAPYWRIRTGIDQGDTASTVETNLALALKKDASVKDVDFETVWGQGHTMAERTGDSTKNFIAWVNKCSNQ